MQCPSCGAVILNGDAIVCNECGRKVDPSDKPGKKAADALMYEGSHSQYEPHGIRQFFNVFLDLVSGISYLIPDPETAADTVIFLNDGSLPNDVSEYALSEVEKSIIIHCGGAEVPDASIVLEVARDDAHLCIFGIGKALLEQESAALDKEFIERWCLGFDKYQRLVQACSWSHLESQTGLSCSQFQRCGELISLTEGLTVLPLPVVDLPDNVNTEKDPIYSSFVPGMAGVLGTQNKLEVRDTPSEEYDNRIPELLVSRSKDVLLTMNILALTALTGSIDTPGGMRIPLSSTLVRLEGNYDLYTPKAFEDTAYRKYEEGELRFDGCPGFNTISGRVELEASFMGAWGLSATPYLEL